MQRVVARSAVDDVATVARARAGEIKIVVLAAAKQRVISGARVNVLGAVAAVHPVAAAAGGEIVVAGKTINRVIGSTADEAVGAGTAVDLLGLRRAAVVDGNICRT